jgi:hypothetical protein
MNQSNEKSPNARIDARLKAVAKSADVQPAWYRALAQLTPSSTDEERLAVYQRIRKEGALPDEASFFLVATLIDDIATNNADKALGGYEDRLKTIESEYRLTEGSIWPSGTAPDGYEELRRQYHRAWDNVFADKLEQLGEPEMAQLFREDSARFGNLTDLGRQYFFGPESSAENEPVIWLHQLVDDVARCITADSPMGPLGYGGSEEDGVWEIDIYPVLVELIGGAVDGEIVAPDFSLDLEALRILFDQVDGFEWQAIGLTYPEGSRVSIEGLYHGHEVILQVLACAPADEEPGMKLDTKPKRG